MLSPVFCGLTASSRPLVQPNPLKSQQSTFQDTSSDTLSIRFTGKTSYQRQATELIDRLSAPVLEALRLLNSTNWDSAMHTTKANQKKYLRAKAQYQAACSNQEAYAELTHFMADNRLSTLPLEQRRALAMLKKRFEELVPRPDDHPEFWPLHQELVARENDLARLYNISADPNDLAVQVPKGYDKIFSELVRDLVKDRNRLAQMRGFSDFYAMKLAETGRTEAQLDQVIETFKPALGVLSQKLEFLTAQAQARDYGWPHLLGQSTEDIDQFWHARWRQQYQEKPDPALLAEWNQAKAYLKTNQAQRFSFERLVAGSELTGVLRKTAALLGVPVEWMDEALKKSDLYPRRFKDSGCFTDPISSPDDIRVCVNVDKDPKHRRFFEVRNQLLHEFMGHYVDCRSIKPQLHPLLRRQDSTSSEVFAKFSEGLVYQSEWLASTLGLTEGDLKTMEPGIKLFQLRQAFESLQHGITKTEFERAMYKNPDQDLDALLQSIRKWTYPDTNWGITPGEWAVSSIHLLSYPAYYQNYLLGEVWAAQLRETLKDKFGSVVSPHTGQFFRAYRQNGLLHEPEEQLQQMTGKPLSAQPLIDELTGLADWLESWEAEERQRLKATG